MLYPCQNVSVLTYILGIWQRTACTICGAITIHKMIIFHYISQSDIRDIGKASELIWHHSDTRHFEMFYRDMEMHKMHAIKSYEMVKLAFTFESDRETWLCLTMRPTYSQ